MSDRSLDRMEALLARWEAGHDRRAIFLDCYARMTRGMVREVDAGGFEDPDWVAALLDRFADYYFDSLDAWERADPATPGPWVVAHDATTWSRASPAQLLLAGVNAHINYDLVLTLVDLLGPAWADTSVDELAVRRRDYDRVNDVIAATADEVQDEVLERYMPWTDLVDRAMGRLDEWLAVRLLRSWRSDVWRRTVVLLDAAPERRAGALELRASQCERRGRRLLLRG